MPYEKARHNVRKSCNECGCQHRLAETTHAAQAGRTRPADDADALVATDQESFQRRDISLTRAIARREIWQIRNDRSWQCG